MTIPDELLNQVVCMDCFALMEQIPDGAVDAVITDPPYGLAGRVFDFPHKQYSAVNETWDTEAPVSWMADCTRILAPHGVVICFGVRQSIYALASEGLRLGWRLINDVTWFKPDAPPNFTGRMLTESTERALIFSPSGKKWTYNLNTAKAMNCGINYRDVWTFPMTRETRYHPTQKPTALMERVIELFTAPDAVVCDPFAGSGTTAIAARNTGRRYIAGDSSAEYVAIASRRLAMPYTLPMMFGE